MKIWKFEITNCTHLFCFFIICLLMFYVKGVFFCKHFKRRAVKLLSRTGDLCCLSAFSLFCAFCVLRIEAHPLAPPLNLPTKMVIVSKHNFHRTFLKMTFIDLDILDVLLQTLVMCGIS